MAFITSIISTHKLPCVCEQICGSRHRRPGLYGAYNRALGRRGIGWYSCGRVGSNHSAHSASTWSKWAGSGQVFWDDANSDPHPVDPFPKIRAWYLGWHDPFFRWWLTFKYVPARGGGTQIRWQWWGSLEHLEARFWIRVRTLRGLK